MRRGALEIFRPRRRPWPNARNKSANAPDCSIFIECAASAPFSPSQVTTFRGVRSRRARQIFSGISLPQILRLRSSVRKQNGATRLVRISSKVWSQSRSLPSGLEQERHIQEMHETSVGLQNVEGIMNRQLHQHSWTLTALGAAPPRLLSIDGLASGPACNPAGSRASEVPMDACAIPRKWAAPERTRSPASRCSSLVAIAGCDPPARVGAEKKGT